MGLPTFFTERFGQAQWLICLNTVAQRIYVRRHWETQHQTSIFASMSAAERKEAIVKLSGNLQKSTSLFRKQATEADKMARASYEISPLLARRMKLLTDGDFIKECIMVVIDSLS